MTFTFSGAANFLGGYNSGIQGSIFQNYIQTENGINRVFVRSTRNAGTFTLTATSPGLATASATISSTGFSLTNGLTLVKPQAYTQSLTARVVNTLNELNVFEAKARSCT